MICYRDRTFCTAEQCVNTECTRKLTDAVKESARLVGLPEAERRLPTVRLSNVFDVLRRKEKAMNIEAPSRIASEQEIKPQFFQVWIDVTCGFSSLPEWEWNSPPKLLPPALDEAAKCRQQGYPTRLMPEGVSPRADGSFD